MNRKACLPILLAALGACSNSGAPAPAAAGTVAATPAQEVAECPPQRGYEWLPADITLDMPYHMRRDRYYVDKKGQSRRRVTLEYLQGDKDAIVQDLQDMMAKAGFKARNRKDQDDGDIVLPFVKPGYGNVSFIVNDKRDEEPYHPNARGTLVVDFPEAVQKDGNAAADASTGGE